MKIDLYFHLNTHPGAYLNVHLNVDLNASSNDNLNFHQTDYTSHAKFRILSKKKSLKTVSNFEKISSSDKIHSDYVLPGGMY